MKFKLKIQQKIQFFIITASIVIYITAVGYISLSARKMAYNDAIDKTNSIANEAAKDMKALLDSDMGAVKSLADAFIIYKNFSLEEWHKLLQEVYINVFNKNPNIYGLWDSWELSKTDSTWDKPTGRIAHTVWKDNGTTKHHQELRSLDGDSELYSETKSTLSPSINEPYADVATGDKTESLLMTSLNAPIVEKGEFVAVVSFDITLEQLQHIVEKINPFEGSYAFLISNKGIISAHTNKEFLNKPIDEILKKDCEELDIVRKINNGEGLTYISQDKNGIETYFSFAPFTVINTDTPWSLAIAVPLETIMAEANYNFRISIFVGIIGIIVLAIVIGFIARSITNPLSKITDLLKLLAKGHIDKKMQIQIKTGDEIEEMSEALNSSIEGLNKKVDFANHIGQGDLKKEFELLSDEDILGKSLIEMRTSLIKADEEDEKRNIEDEKRRWTNEGLAKFADILRQNNDDIEQLATKIITNLVGYLDANQGGVFILNDDDPNNIYFNLLSAYAYDRRKFMEKHIELGEGLVGNCAIEKKTIFLTEIPQDYVEITSGLGGANPNSLLIVPLKIEETVLGVIEIASFKVFQNFEIEFVEKLAESIASTLSSVKINIKTSELLESSQQQAEEMTAQEEEMRQNMEELQATQEEMRRKEDHLKGIIEEMKEHEEKLKKTIDKYKNQQ